MRSFILMGALLLITGCQSTVGPFQSRKPERVDDPLLTISEQERRGRDRLALPEESRSVLPRTYSDFLGPNGR